MCGGSLEILPCSRIGHLFRISTYSFNGDATEIKKRNNVRVVEVWMDEFKDFFYAADPRMFSFQTKNKQVIVFYEKDVSHIYFPTFELISHML